MTPNQKRGEHGEVATKVVGGVRVNDDVAEAKAEKAAAKAADATAAKPDYADYEAMSKAELQEALDKKGVEYNASATKSDLIDLLK